MRARGPILLLITAALWGLAFTAQTTAANVVGPFTFNAARNIVGAAFLTGVIALRKQTGTDTSPTTPHATYTRRTLLISGTICGILLFGASYLQQAGITAYPPEAAASSRSGFVTATYMVMVATMSVFTGHKLRPRVVVAIMLALGGMYFLCVPHGLGSVYRGDWLVLGSAFGYALHIIAIDHYTHVDGVRLSRVQLLVSAMLSTTGAIVFEQPDAAALFAALVPILYAGIASDGIAYTLQIIGQQTTNPTVASIILTMESVFAAIGGWIILSERLSEVELLGCALVFVAVLTAQLPEPRRTQETSEATEPEHLPANT